MSASYTFYYICNVVEEDDIDELFSDKMRSSIKRRNSQKKTSLKPGKGESHGPIYSTSECRDYCISFIYDYLTVFLEANL